MKEKIAFVAIGQAGGNIGQLLEEKGFNVLYLNTSEEDLATLDMAKHKYHITGGEGCNKDRRKAKQLVIDDYDQIAAEIDAKIKADIIFTVYSSGGGTGSGAGPMLTDLLIDDGYTVGTITVIPALTESIRSHINAYECFSELTKIENMASCFILDNEKGKKLDLNREFVDNFASFVEIPVKNKNIEGNVDKAEIIETLKSHGMAVIVQSTGNSADIIQRLNNSIYARTEQDRAVKYLAAVLGADVDIRDIEKEVGIPVDTFQTYSDHTILCVSGLSYPQQRLEEVYKRVETNRETVKKNLSATHETEMKADVDFLHEPAPGMKKSPEKKSMSRRDLLGKYL